MFALRLVRWPRHRWRITEKPVEDGPKTAKGPLNLFARFDRNTKQIRHEGCSDGQLPWDDRFSFKRESASPARLVTEDC